MRNKWLGIGPRKVEYYKGLEIHSDPAVHAAASALLQRVAPTGARVLDLGAGAGAFSQRLADQGFHPTGVDASAAEWTSGLPFVQADLNGDWASHFPTPFDAVCCLEVIEHLENPWKLLRDVRKVLGPGGRLVLSTPNTTSFVSRLTFLRIGQFAGFGKDDLSYGHVSPLSPFEFSTVAAQTGWHILHAQPSGILPIFEFEQATPRALATNALRAAAYVLAKGQKHGRAMVYALEVKG